MSQIIINGVSHVGDSLTITNNGNSIIIDGKDISIGDATKIVNIDVQGNINELDAGSGRVKVTGNVGKIRTGSGDVEISGNVGGDVSTGSGDVDCGEIKGSVKTGSGDITHK